MVEGDVKDIVFKNMLEQDETLQMMIDDEEITEEELRIELEKTYGFNIRVIEFTFKQLIDETKNTFKKWFN